MAAQILCLKGNPALYLLSILTPSSLSLASHQFPFLVLFDLDCPSMVLGRPHTLSPPVAEADVPSVRSGGWI
ncbi:hypothetical protein IE53DRAFT_384505 [Violaceomyces palustris]|uniref:Uncharacterized protein n=1 Tax=Violaceomyces palustris TaxID=1673888 RepID=A0ACD0P4N8_9BASI|nr:hypothetical protein IE53DRAFT_384505 [Violaceomyces palustris]